MVKMRYGLNRLDPRQTPTRRIGTKVTDVILWVTSRAGDAGALHLCNRIRTPNAGCDGATKSTAPRWPNSRWRPVNSRWVLAR